MKGKKVLVAGGTGLVGANLTRALLDQDADVVATRHTGTPLFSPETYAACDLTDYNEVLELTRGRDIVFACAAVTGGPQMMKERPTASLLPNIQIGAGLLEACAVNGVKQLQILSSATVYQSASDQLREDDLDLNQPPHGAHFGVGWFNRYLEKLAEHYAAKTDMKITVLRPSSIYGPHDTFADGKAHVIPALIKRALDKEDPFSVWGDGLDVRDFLYVGDLVEDMIKLIDVETGPEPINVGSGEPISIGDLVNAVLEVSEHAVAPSFDASMPSSSPYRAVNIERLRGFRADRSVTPLHEGLKTTIDWYTYVGREHVS